MDNKVTWFLYIWALVCLEFATSFLSKWTGFLQRWIVLLPQDAKTATIFKAKIIIPMLSTTFKTPHFSYALFRKIRNWENKSLRWIPKQLLAPILYRTWLSAAPASLLCLREPSELSPNTLCGVDQGRWELHPCSPNSVIFLHPHLSQPQVTVLLNYNQ